MKNIKTFESFSVNENSSKTKEEIVSEYTNKHNSDFFKKFLETFPSEKDFSRHSEKTSGVDDIEDFNIDDEWTPEGEVHMLEQEVGTYPGDDIWVDFHNDLMDTDWIV